MRGASPGDQLTNSPLPAMQFTSTLLPPQRDRPLDRQGGLPRSRALLFQFLIRNRADRQSFLSTSFHSLRRSRDGLSSHPKLTTEIDRPRVLEVDRQGHSACIRSRLHADDFRGQRRDCLRDNHPHLGLRRCTLGISHRHCDRMRPRPERSCDLSSHARSPPINRPLPLGQLPFRILAPRPRQRDSHLPARRHRQAQLLPLLRPLPCCACVNPRHRRLVGTRLNLRHHLPPPPGNLWLCLALRWLSPQHEGRLDHNRRLARRRRLQAHLCIANRAGINRFLAAPIQVDGRSVNDAARRSVRTPEVECPGLLDAGR